MYQMRTWKCLNILLAILMTATSGCRSGVSQWWYVGEENPEQEHYRQAAMEIDYTDVVQPLNHEVEKTAPPRTIISRKRDEVWDLPLQEAIHMALANNDIIRSSSTFLSPGSPLFTNPSNVASVYDPAIQASGVLFGGVSVEAALADFDATWSNALFFGRNETIQNSPFGGGVEGGTLEVDSAQFNTALTKQFSYGANFTLSHDVNYNATNSPNVLFPSVYTGNVQAEYRQQLLAGAGPEFVKVAGPLSPQFTSIAGVGNGVLIARINEDISITNFESNIRNLVKDVEDTYWDLYLAYRTFDTAVTARNTALRTWRNAKFTQAAGGKVGFTLQDEAQSRDRYFETRAQAEASLGELYVTEQRLRNLLGISVNDNKIIRPADAPIAARIHADWYHSLAEALTERVELRRQKWNIKSLELQLGAARNFARPRLDFVARYRVNGFGDDLLGYTDEDEFGGDLNNMYESITQGDQTGWDLGMELSMPIGLRLAKTQVRNIELRLTKARKVLAAQELEISHELAVAFQQLETAYATAVSNYSRRQAAMDRFRIESALLEGGTGSFDMNLRAQESLATAANQYHTSLVDYNKALVNLYFRKGTLLREDNIHLAEGQWDPAAYVDAYSEAKARANGIPAPHLHTSPPAFAADGHMPSFGFTAPEAAQGHSPADGMELSPYPEEMPLPLPTDEALAPADDSSTNELPQAPGESQPNEPAAPKAAPGTNSEDKSKYFEEPLENQPISPSLRSSKEAAPMPDFKLPQRFRSSGGPAGSPDGSAVVQLPTTMPENSAADSNGIASPWKPTDSTGVTPASSEGWGLNHEWNDVPGLDPLFPETPSSGWENSQPQSRPQQPASESPAQSQHSETPGTASLTSDEASPNSRPASRTTARSIGRSVPTYR